MASQAASASPRVLVSQTHALASTPPSQAAITPEREELMNPVFAVFLIYAILVRRHAAGPVRSSQPSYAGIVPTLTTGFGACLYLR